VVGHFLVVHTLKYLEECLFFRNFISLVEHVELSINHSIFVSVGQSCRYDRFVQARGSLQHLSTFDRSKKLLNHFVASRLVELQVLFGNLGMGMVQELGVVLKNLKHSSRLADF
jgi:hypothetical protein